MKRAFAVAVLALVVMPPSPSSAAGDAPGGPGAESHFGLARKDCLGTARNRESKVWFTVAGGVLSDAYFPTNDTTNVETLQFVVTDGQTFTDMAARDMVHEVEGRDGAALTCRVTSTGRDGRYRLVTDYVTDPERATVVMRTRFEALQGRRDDYRVYVRFDPSLNGNGGGGAGNGGADSGVVAASGALLASDPVTATNAANRDYAVPVHAALVADKGFTEASSGFAGGASDGLTQLDAARRLTATYDRAAGGNVVQTGRIDVRKHAAFELALGFGTTSGGAEQTARESLRENFEKLRHEYVRGWDRYDKELVKPGGLPRAARDAYYLNANLIKAAEDKTFPGAVVASLASPWGQAVSAGDPQQTYFGSYREVFARDLYETWTALHFSGDGDTASDAVRFLFERQQLPDGSLPRNSLVNGKLAPDSFGIQLDEVAYPLLMARDSGLTDPSFYADHLKRAANFVISRGPAFGSERWEEQSGFSPSTISAEVAGLVAAADVARRNGDRVSEAVWLGVADHFQRNIKRWTLTSNGPEAPHPYFIRLSKTGDPNADIDYNVGNGGPTLDQREVIDAGFLEYVRLGLLPADDPDVAASLPVVDGKIRRATPAGAGFLRYNGDGYGDRSSDGRPWAPSGQGNGHVWPLLAGERAQYELATGTGTPLERLDAMRRMGGGVGLIPEQTWELPPLARSPFGTDPTQASIGFAPGAPAGSAAPLTWSASQYVRLALNLAAGRNLDRPADTTSRYVENTQGETQLTVTAPADESEAGATATVTGTSAPGNTISIAVTNTDAGFQTTTAQTQAGPSGAFSVDVAVPAGTNVVTIVATSPSGATAYAKRTVVREFAPGTLVLDHADPDGDDNGPGNYAYPTSSNFRPGAYDLRRFQVFDDAANDRVVFRVHTRDLTPTFGSPLGAQLVDVYAFNPAAGGATSTAASFPGRNYTIAPAGAWNRLIEVQGFGQRFVDASNTGSLGTVTISANQILRTISFSVPKAALGGTPGPGWRFTVVLTGQDGFSPDQARGFAPTPQEFAFGVCPAPDPGNPRCSADPGTVPKAIDILVPAGASQAEVLDYTAGPVEIEPIAMP